MLTVHLSELPGFHVIATLLWTVFRKLCDADLDVLSQAAIIYGLVLAPLSCDIMKKWISKRHCEQYFVVARELAISQLPRDAGWWKLPRQ